MPNWVWELSEALPFLKWWFYGIVVALVLMYLSLDTFPGGRTDPKTVEHQRRRMHEEGRGL
jgi:hypothetical protein